MHVMYSALLAGFINLILIPLILRIAHRNQWFDQPDERKIHKENIPRLGGIGIFWAGMLGLAISYGLLVLSGSAGMDALRQYWPVLAGALVIHFTGLADDFLDLKARFKFLIQVGVAILLVATGFVFKTLWIPFVNVEFQLGYAAWPLTALWIVGVVNAVNLIDGMDGLCSSISGVVVLCMGLVLLGHGQDFPALVAFAFAGSLVGYLFFNFPPASIFMGDSGSTVLGFLIAVLPLMDSSAANTGLWFWDAVLLASIPIFDTVASMWRRRREGVPMMSPDKWHMHHKLLKLGLNARSILNIILPVMIFLGFLVIQGYALSPAVHSLMALGGIALVAAAFIILHYLKERQIRQGNAHQ